MSTSGSHRSAVAATAQPNGTDILLVAPNLGDGGTQRVVTVLARALHESGRRVSVATLYRGRDEYSLPDGVRRISLGGGRIPWCLRMVAVASKWLWRAAGRPARWAERRLQRLVPLEWAWRLHLPTVLRIRGLRALVAELGPRRLIAFCGSTNVIAVLACAGTVPRLIISERNDPDRQTLAHPWNELRRRLYRRADIVTANSEGALETMNAYVPRERLRYVPNPLWEATPGEPALPVDGEARRLLIVGRLHPQKAHDVLLAAFARIVDRMPEWRLGIVGSGELEDELRALSAKLGIAERVDWYGQVRDPYVHYRAASIFVLPSRHEGSPNALLEALSIGLAAIVSDASPGPLELVRHGVNGLVVPSEDVEALAGAMLDLAKDAALRRRLGAAAMASVDEHRLPNVLAVWDQLIGREP